MREEAAAFYGEAKTWWRVITPVLDCRFGWEAIEAVIDFDGVEMTDIPREIL